MKSDLIGRLGLSSKRDALRQVLRRITTPLLPDDYTQLVHPLWSARELRGQIVSVSRDAADVVSLVIKPGWGMTPEYQAGQYIGIGVLIDGRWTWRSYSLTSTPEQGDGLFSVTVKALPEGKLSNHLVGTASAGTVIRLAAPAGDFALPSPAPAQILFITAGSGITPVIGMLRTLDRRAEAGEAFPDIHHVHSVRDEADLLFAEELRDLAARREGYTLDLQVTSRDGRFGPADLDARVPDWARREAWACGPTQMLDAFEEHRRGADEAGWSEVAALHTERFAIDRDSNASGGEVTFAPENRSVEVDGATTLLEAGEKIGVRMPFGCRMGICQTCVVEIADGYVRDLRSGTDHGPGERIQTCICAAAGDVTLNI